jgi:hypothetical protein
MTLKDVLTTLGAEPACTASCNGSGDRQIASCHASDLLSDVLTFRGPGSLLLTGLTNAQVIRTAEMSDFAAICLVRGKKPQPETVQLAKEKMIPLFVTELSMFESCGRLFAAGLPVGHKEEGTGGCRTKR